MTTYTRCALIIMCANQDQRPSLGSSPSVGCEDAPEVVELARLPATVEKYWWHVNKGGFPIQESTWKKMWDYIVAIHPEGEDIAKSIRGKSCKIVPLPSDPSVSLACSADENLLAVQQYMNELQYNHIGTQFFDIKKTRPLSRLMENAKEIIAESLPIKCLEAVILAIYLTSPLTNIQRFTISFKSRFNGLYYRHVVLGVSSNSSYGALGLSRRIDLMYKPLVYKSLPDLILDYIHSYRNYGHIVHKLKVSRHIVHDITSGEHIQWKFFALNIKEQSDEDIKKLLDKLSRTIRSL